MRTTLPLALGLGSALTLLSPAARAQSAADPHDPYEDAFARSAELSREGRADEAAMALERLLQAYPQDFALPLQIAWIHFRAGRFAVAEEHYRLALSRSPGAHEARLGLAASLAAQDRCEEARPLYESLARERPDLEAAREGIARCAPKPAFKVTLGIQAHGSHFADHPGRGFAAGGSASASLWHESGFHLGGTYRYGHFFPAATSSLSAWDQHEGYFTLGFGRELAGIAAHYGIISDGSGALGLSHHFGFTGRLSLFGDLEVRGSASLYDDMKVYRIEPSWKIPVAFGLSVRPGAAFASAGGELQSTGMVTLALDRPSFSLWAGGKYGDETRPVYFNVPVVYDMKEKIAYGLWAGAGVNVAQGARIQLTYAMDRLKATDSSFTADAHTLGLGAVVTF